VSELAAIYIVDETAEVRANPGSGTDSASPPGQVYDSWRELLEELKPETSGCIILDPAASGTAVVDLVNRLLTDGHHIPVIALSRCAIGKGEDSHKRAAEMAAIRRRMSTLTHRELDLLRLVVAGKPNKQIAADLGISIKTVANHRAHLMAKTQALNAADLARMSTSAGVIHA
jgi:FixJ family two-component response regulator